MDSVIKIFSGEMFRKAASEPDEKEKLLSDIRQVSRLINEAYERFEYESDSDLVEAAVYELESLKARYRYLIRLAKKSDIKCDKVYTVELIKEKGLDDMG